MSNPYRFTFYVNDEVYENLTYANYLGREKLMKAVTDPSRRRLFLGTEVHSYDHDWLLAHKDKKAEFDHLWHDWKYNRLKYYLPNSREQLAFLNDWEHDVVAMVAPNRVGKTTVGVVKTLISGILPLDPEWPIFKKHGVKYRQYLGSDRELKFAYGSYEWTHIKSVVWPRVREYIPDEMLGAYSMNPTGRSGKPRRDPNFERMPAVELGCGLTIKFHAYSQSQSAFESDAYHGMLYDEQPPENIFNAVDERTRTLKGWHCFSLTPHKVEGRADTGGGGWLQKFLTGDERRGHNPVCYNTSLADVPDWIYPESEKVKAMEKWIHEPTRNRNMKMLREGRSRVFGEWHKTSGLVLDEWERSVHVIDSFKIPIDWTLYRALDHGITNPTVCLWFAVSPPKGDFGSDVVVYREFYSQGKTINENVVDVISLSRNSRSVMGDSMKSSDFSRSNVMMAMFEEIQSGEVYAKTVLDGRSFALTDTNTGKPYGYIYKTCGLPVQPASGKNSQHWVPLLKEMLAPKLDDNHVFNKGVTCRPRLMIFRECVNLIREIEGWVWEEYRSGGDWKNAKESPRKKDDHGCTAMGYAVQIPLTWRGDIYQSSSRTSSFRSYSSAEVSNNNEYRGI